MIKKECTNYKVINNRSVDVKVYVCTASTELPRAILASKYDAVSSYNAPLYRNYRMKRISRLQSPFFELLSHYSTLSLMTSFSKNQTLLCWRVVFEWRNFLFHESQNIVPYHATIYSTISFTQQTQLIEYVTTYTRTIHIVKWSSVCFDIKNIV